MNRLAKIVCFILLMMFLPGVFKAIFTFFGIDFAIYSPYIMWIYFLMFLFAILPAKKSVLV